MPSFIPGGIKTNYNELIIKNNNGTEFSLGEDHIALKDDFENEVVLLNLLSVNVKSIPNVVYDGVVDDSAAIQAYLDDTTFYKLKLEFPLGRCKCPTLVINKRNVIVDGEGTLIDCEIACSGLAYTTSGQEYTIYPIIRNVEFYTETARTLNAITMDHVRKGQIKDIKVTNYNAVLKVADYNQTQHVNRIWLNSIQYWDCNYLFYCDRPSGSTILPTADVHIIDCMGTARIQHIHSVGIDGLNLHGSTMLFGPNTTKQQNVYLDYATWILVYGNNLFEAGTEGISVSHFQNVTISNNNIAWSGQLHPASGIKLSGGDMVAGRYSFANVFGNIIDRPTGKGIYVRDNCSYINVNGNLVYFAGCEDYYIGDVAELEGVDHSGIAVGPDTNGVSVVGNNCPSNINSFNSNNINSDSNLSGTASNSAKFKSIQATFNKDATTITMLNADSGLLANTVETYISNIQGGYEGKEITLMATTTGTTALNGLAAGGNIYFKEMVNTLIPKGKSIHFKYVYSGWREMGRDF